MLLDVSLFKYNHPGGFFMFQKVYGQDIGKFINGCSSPDDTRPYYHTESARDMLKHLKIKNMAYASEVFDQVGAGESFESMQWSLANKVQIAKSTYCLEFTSPIWQMKAQPPGYEWMGKHFQVKAKIGGKVIRRYYSLCAVNLASWANEVRSHGFSTKEYSIAQNKNHLRLHLKHYRGGLMTTHLTEIPTGSFVTLKGPLGPGLLIDSEIENDYLVFGAGTGILPFLDIIYAIWCGRLPKAILHVYCSFRDDESSFAVELIEATAKRYPANIKLYARAGEAGFQLHSEFWRNILPLHGAKMAWICGPPPFNRKIIKILKGEGFKADNIIVI
jgi:ferredoxin-NADP reductase